MRATSTCTCTSYERRGKGKRERGRDTERRRLGGGVKEREREREREWSRLPTCTLTPFFLMIALSGVVPLYGVHIMAFMLCEVVDSLL